MAKEYLVTETYFGSRKVVVTYGEYTGEDFDPWDCDGSDPTLGRKADRYYFEVTWF